MKEKVSTVLLAEKIFVVLSVIMFVWCLIDLINIQFIRGSTVIEYRVWIWFLVACFVLWVNTRNLLRMRKFRMRSNQNETEDT